MFEETNDLNPPVSGSENSPLPPEPPLGEPGVGLAGPSRLTGEGGLAAGSVEEEPTEIHTMPAKFLTGKEKKGGGEGKSSKWLIILIIVVVVLGLAVAGIYLFKKLPQSNTNQNLNVLTNVKTNANTNINVNKNTNTNASSNTNANANVNLNANANLNANTNLNVNLNANANLNANTNTIVIIPSSQDSDNDQLTDVEEALFTTDSKKPDTDGDSYLDGVEIKNRYSPKAGPNVKIKGTDLAKTYTNPTYNYSVLYPSTWLAQATAADNKEIIFSAETGEFVQVSIEDNPGNLSALEWFLAKSPGTDSSKIVETTIGGLKGVNNYLNDTIYLASGTRIYVLSYNLGTKAEANFRTTFAMISSSFALGSGASTNTNVNVNAKTNTNTNAKTNANANINANANKNLNSNVNTSL